MTRRFILLAALGLGLASLQPSYAADPVKIGFSIPKTGLFAAGTGSQWNAYQLWKDQVNAQGGLDVKGVKRPIVFDWYDDQSDPGKAVQIYEKLITDDKVDLLLAPWGTPAHIAVAGVVERYHFPVIGDSAASVKLRDLKSSYMWFTTGGMPDSFAKAMADALKANGIKTAALLTAQLPFALEVKSFLVPALKANDIAVKIDENYPPSIKDMTALLTTVKDAAPDAVIALSFPADTALYMKQARELNITARFQFVEVGASEDWFIKEFGASTDGIVTMGDWTPAVKQWPKAKPFFDAYQAKFHETADYLDSSLAYMSCEILAQAVAKVGLDKEALRNEIATDTFDTISGPVKFKGVENAITPAGLLQIQKGKMEMIWPPSLATAKFEAKPAWPVN
jgi:branched-chain amino acid transport system substrate-binding protein